MSAQSMARVCVVRCHYYRDTRLQREVGAMLERGHTVHVLCLRDEAEPTQERRNRLTITRIPIRHKPGAGNLRRLTEYMAFFVVTSIAVTAMHLRRRVDLVQVNSVPDALVFAVAVPRLAGARILIDLQEPFPEFFASRSGVGADHWAVRFIVLAEQLSIRFAHAAITATEPMRQAFIGRGAPPDKITVVMDASDAKAFNPHTLPARERDPERFTLVSHGTIEPHYGLDTVIRAVARLSSSIPSIELRIVGDGSQRSELQKLAAGLGVADRVVFSPGFVPIDELVATLAGADVGVVAMKRDPFRDLTLAGKMFDFIAMGIPMAVSTTQSVQSTFPPGCFEPFVADDPCDLARAVTRLHRDADVAASYVDRAREAARPYSWSVQRERYQGVVNALLDGSIPTNSPNTVGACTGVSTLLPETG